VTGFCCGSTQGQQRLANRADTTRADCAQPCRLPSSPESTRTRVQPLLIPRSQVRILPGPCDPRTHETTRDSERPTVELFRSPTAPVNTPRIPRSRGRDLAALGREINAKKPNPNVSLARQGQHRVNNRRAPGAAAISQFRNVPRREMSEGAVGALRRDGLLHADDHRVRPDQVLGTRPAESGIAHPAHAVCGGVVETVLSLDEHVEAHQ
jgi:hypothetical protein